jgi:hypothetical protein
MPFSLAQASMGQGTPKIRFWASIFFKASGPVPGPQVEQIPSTFSRQTSQFIPQGPVGIFNLSKREFDLRSIGAAGKSQERRYRHRERPSREERHETDTGAYHPFFIGSFQLTWVISSRKLSRVI